MKAHHVVFIFRLNPPYGYQKVRVNDVGKERTRLEINEYQAHVVEDIFKDIAKGEGLTSIVKQLNGKGISGPRDKGWSKTGLYEIVKNEIYIGTMVWGRNSKRNLPPIRTENACPAIVNKELFYKVQKLLKKRSFTFIHPRRASSHYLLSGLGRCRYCGKALIGVEAKSGDFSYYICGTLNKKGAGSCQARYLNASKMDTLVLDQIRDRILTPDNLSNLAREVSKELNTASEEYANELKSVEKEITDVKRRLECHYEYIESGKVFPKDLGERIHELVENREKLEARRKELEIIVMTKSVEIPKIEELRQYTRDLKTLLEYGSFTERQEFVRSFVKEV